MRLAKFLATAGVASRRAAEEIVRAERVTVNGATVTDPARDVGEGDAVAVDGAVVSIEAERAVYAVNKPAGVVSTAHDPSAGRRSSRWSPHRRACIPWAGWTSTPPG